MSDLKELAKQYFETFNRKDLDGIAGMFTDNAALRDWGYWNCKGKSDVLIELKKTFDDFDSLIVTPITLYEEGNTVIAELELLMNNIELVVVVDILTFEGDKIASVRAYKG
jgi:ketosteroid isomerase-like protein